MQSLKYSSLRSGSRLPLSPCNFLKINNIKSNPTDINIDLIKEFLYVNSGKIKSRSQSRQISSLKSFFGYLVFENIIKISPIDIIDSPKVGIKLPETLTNNEVNLILKSINDLFWLFYSK